MPKIDILIDDGGHTMQQQIATYEELFPHIDPNGVYLCEDLHTSYWPEYGGGYNHRGTFVEYSKKFIDHINAWHATEGSQLQVTEFTKSAYSLHYYDSVLVIERRPVERSQNLMIGTASVPDFSPLPRKEAFWKRLFRRK
jgi:hypothetical protein